MSNKYAVPTELKKDGRSHFYKHIVPTKSTPNARLAFVGTEERWGYTFFYKHIVPTKSTPNARLAFVGTEEKALPITKRIRSDSSDLLSFLKFTPMGFRKITTQPTI